MVMCMKISPVLHEYKLVSLFQIKRGMRLKSEDREPGDIRYFSASESNNGQTDRISNPLFVEKDALIYTTFGDCFWIDGVFTASDEISILKNPKMDKNSGLYIACVINQNKYKYAFGRKAFYNKYCNEVISLPFGSEDEPDWNYMRNYIASLRNKAITTQIKQTENIINTASWKEYKIKEMFIVSVSKDANMQNSNKGSIPYVSSTAENNGVSGYVDSVPSQKGNTLTIARNGSVGSTFYQAISYCSSPDDVRVLIPKFKMNVYNAMFIKTIIENEKYKYAYGRKLGTKRIENMIIKLPTTREGLPDIEYMENYIKLLPFSDRI